MDVQVRPLLKLSAIDAPPKFLQSLQDAGKFVKKLRDADADIVNSPANRSGNEEEHRTLQAGLLYLALTEPDRRRSFCTDIVLTSRDNLTYVLSEMTRLVAETWLKMPQSVRSNLINLLNELIATRDASVEVLMLHIYRRMSNGDLSPPNIWLIESMTDLIEKNKEWLGSPDRLVFLLPLTVFTVLRLIPDHFSGTGALATTGSISETSLANLRHRELSLVDELIRKHFDRCAQIGRDFIRLLHGVARLDPIKGLWNDILTNMSSLSSHYTDVSEILEITTPQYFTQTLIPHEMEQWARWMMKNVHCVPRVPVNRYQDFFQRKFFATPESQSLRVNLLRYIVTFFYPDNEMLASTLIPRWNVISWLLSQSTCPLVTANAKLALFYDWLFFKPNDCIMNLEPALLAIMNHLTPRTQPIALSLTDFLVKISASYYPPLTDRIIAGVRSGLEEMIRLGVVKNINPLFEMLHRTSPDLFRSLRLLLGCEPSIPPILGISPLEVGAVAGNPAALGALGGVVKPELKVDPLVSAAPGVGSIAPGVARRPSTPPLSSGKPKPTGTTEAGSLVDPRLTRGHAAIRAGVVPPTPVIATTQPDIIVPKAPVEPSGVMAAHTAALPSTPPPPLLQQPPPTLTNMDSASMPDEITIRGGVKRASLTVPLTPRAVTGATSVEPPLLSEDDLDQLKIDATNQGDFGLSRASWSPPPLPPSQPAYRSRQDQLPETPESMELTIDNLRRRFQEYNLWYHYSVKPVDVNALIEQLDGPIRLTLEKFRDLALKVGLVRNTGTIVCADRSIPRDPDPDVINGCVDQQRLTSVRLRSASVLGELCEAMEAFVQAVLDEDCFDDLVIAARIASVVCELLYPLFAERLMPAGTEWSEEQLEDCLEFPIFVPFRHLWQMNPGDPKREVLLLLLSEMQTRQPRLGYHLLFFLKVGKLNDEKMVTYRNFCASQENPSLQKSLLKDMQLLADDNRRLFAYLLPDVFTVFSSELTNNVDFMRLVVGTLDPTMLNTLICEIVRGHLNLFRSNDLSPMLKASLQWDSIEQLFFWQLVNAHEIPTRRFLPLVRCVEPAKHPEACANLIQLFKLEKPNYELVRALLSRPKPDDPLSVTSLHFWSCPDNHGSLFAEILSEMITVPLSFRSDSNTGTTREGRDRRRNGAKNQITPENAVDLSLILTHLDSIRRNCKNMSILQDADIQNALQSVANSQDVPVSVKDHFSDLLALAEDQPTPPSVGGSTRTATSASQSSGTGTRLNGNLGSNTETSSRRGSAAGRGVAFGSKGGHSLRNLDSRRAAEAERRQTPSTTTKRSSRGAASSGGNTQTSNECDSDADDDGVISLVSSSSSVSSASSDNDEEAENTETGSTVKSSTVTQKKRRSRNSSPVRGNVTKTGKRAATTTSDAKERKSVSSIGGAKRASTRTDPEPSPPKTAALDDSVNGDDEDDDDEDKGLEVVVLEEDSDDEQSSDRIRPPKRRKTANRRFNLDD